MKYPALLLLCLSSLQAQIWQPFPVPVIHYGDTLALPWTGGLNNPVFSNIDLNFDGKNDLVIYEKNGNTILPFVQQGTGTTPDFDYAPAYTSAFPQLDATWILLQDFTCDNQPDLFAGTSTGRILCYRNTSPAGGPLQFTLYTTALKTRYPFFTDLSYTITDLPAFTDVDGDSDLDILTFGGISTTVEWHRNYAMENFSRCDTFDFVMETDCWGQFSENQFNNNVTLNLSCKGNTGGNKTLHSGSTLLALDADGNGTREIIIGDISYNTLVFLTNGGTPQNAHMTAKDTTFPAYDVPADVQVFPAAYYVDVTGDNIRDLVVAPFPENASWNVGNVWYYLNTTTDNNPVFSFQTDSLLNGEMIDIGTDANIAVLDENGDGLTDLLLGNYLTKTSGQSDRSRLVLYHNTGTPTQPAFTLASEDYLSLSTLLGPAVAGLYPACGDIDGDNDTDLLIGDMEGRLHLLLNQAGPGNPVQFTLFAQQYNGIDVGAFATPQLADIDLDGRTDILCGKENGTLSFFSNTGGPSGFSFPSIADDSFWGQVDVQIPCCTGYSAPHAFRLPGDTAYTLWVGSESGKVYQYSGVSAQTGTTFTLTDSLIQGVEGRSKIRVLLHDITQDGQPELWTGNTNGGVQLYTIQNGNALSETTSPPEIKWFPNPAGEHLSWSFLHTGSFTYTLRNIHGTTVLSGTATTQEGMISLRGVPAGIYSMETQWGGKKWVGKIVMKK